MRVRHLLAVRGIHYLVTRFGFQRLRSLAFDEKYKRGDWKYESDGGRELIMVLCRYLRRGDILILGCGGASILKDLESSGFESALGVDLSEEAIRMASRYAADNISFQVADMEAFLCPHPYDVILLSESLYYIPTKRQLPLLRRFAGDLKIGGAIVATFAQENRYKDIIERIRKNFIVLEDHSLPGSERHLIAFRMPLI